MPPRNQLGPDNRLFPDSGPTLADAWSHNASAYSDWLAQQRASGVQAGMINPATGWPTSNALLDAAKQYGNAIMAGTSAPGSGKLGAMESPGKGTISPTLLKFREAEQNNTDAVRELFPEGEGYFPVVTTSKNGEHTILDGHNRAAVAAERGDDLPYVSIPHSAYQALKKHGFDDQEISYAALTHAGQDDAASGISQKFPGANVATRGMQALDKLWDLPEYGD